MQSPIIKFCVLDPATGLCEGCHRTFSESWFRRLSADERRRIMLELPARRARLKAE